VTAAPLTKRKESDITNAILALLRVHGIAAWRTGVGAFRASYQGRERFVRLGTPGMADIVGILPGGQALFVEVKSPTGRVRPEQLAFLQTVARAGGFGFVARSVDDVKETLDL